MDALGLPCGNEELTGIDTAGVGGAAAIPATGVATGYVTPRLAKVYVSAKAYVCFGDDATPDGTVPDRAVVQQATTEVLYALPADTDGAADYLWIYAKATTISADVSFFGA